MLLLSNKGYGQFNISDVRLRKRLRDVQLSAGSSVHYRDSVLIFESLLFHLHVASFFSPEQHGFGG